MAAFTVTDDNGLVQRVEVPLERIQRFEILCEDMRALLLEIRQDVPVAGLWLEDGTPHLVLGPTHIGPRQARCWGNTAATGAEWPLARGGRRR